MQNKVKSPSLSSPPFLSLSRDADDVKNVAVKIEMIFFFHLYMECFVRDNTKLGQLTGGCAFCTSIQHTWLFVSVSMNKSVFPKQCG